MQPRPPANGAREPAPQYQRHHVADGLDATCGHVNMENTLAPTEET